MDSGDQKSAWETWYSGQPRPWRGSADLGWVGFVPGERVLDAGCGNGKTTSVLLDAGCTVTGIDLSTSAVSECARRFGNRGVFIEGDICCLPFPDSSFDTVVSVHCLEHNNEENERLALSEFMRVLVPGGRLVMQMFARGDFRSDGKQEDVRNGILYRYHTPESATELLKDWNIERMESIDMQTRFGTLRRRLHIIAIRPHSEEASRAQ